MHRNFTFDNKNCQKLVKFLNQYQNGIAWFIIHWLGPNPNICKSINLDPNKPKTIWTANRQLPSFMLMTLKVMTKKKANVPGVRFLAHLIRGHVNLMLGTLNFRGTIKIYYSRKNNIKRTTSSILQITSSPGSIIRKINHAIPLNYVMQGRLNFNLMFVQKCEMPLNSTECVLNSVMS